jgi:dTDP-4-dehydrorhamnose reductase
MNPDRQKILIVGGNSHIGESLQKAHLVRGDAVTRTTRRNPAPVGERYLDLASNDPERLPDGPFDIAYLCGGVTSLRSCEEFPAETARINVQGTLDVIRHLSKRGVFIGFFSSNLVFDGTLPFVLPNSRWSAVCAYGRQKAAVEKEMADARIPAAVIRLTKVLDKGNRLFGDWASSLRSGRPIEPFADMVMAPIDMESVIGVTVAAGLSKQASVIQLSAAEDITYEVAAAHLARSLDADLGLVRPRLSRKVIGPRLHRPRHTTLRVPDGLDGLPDGAPSAYQAIDQFALGAAAIL